MKLEIGRFYSTRDGRKAGPVTKNEGGFKWGPGWDFAADVEHVSRTYHGSGAHSNLDSNSPLDLVAEWSPSAPSETEPSTRAGVPCGVEASEAAIVEAFNGLVKAGRLRFRATSSHTFSDLSNAQWEAQLKPPPPKTRTCTLPDSEYEVVLSDQGHTVKIGCQAFDRARLINALRDIVQYGGVQTLDNGCLRIMRGDVLQWQGAANHTITWRDADTLLAFLEEK